jgi:NADPH:quinone reductase-like Zn-dependent oxidoreductase
MPRAVKFDRYGGTDVLRVVEVDRPVPGPQQVLIGMKAAGINPGEAAIREGAFAKQWPATFPSGQGSDLAGVVEAVGSAVRNVAVGDEVIGFTNNRSSHAELVVVEADHLIGRPTHVSWEQAGALFVAGTTAYAAVHAVSLKADDTVVISGAAGGVGSIAVQLAKILGAKVIGLASAANHTWLAEHGVIAVAYGEGVADRIRAASGGKIDAFIDAFGGGYVDLALELGVAPGRIDTIPGTAGPRKPLHDARSGGTGYPGRGQGFQGSIPGVEPCAEDGSGCGSIRSGRLLAEHPKLTGGHGDGIARHADGLGLEPNWLPFSRGEGIWGRTSKSNGVVVRIPKYLIRCPNA